MTLARVTLLSNSMFSWWIFLYYVNDHAPLTTVCTATLCWEVNKHIYISNKVNRIKPYIKFFWFLHSFLSSFNSLIIHTKIWTESPLKFKMKIWLVTSKKSSQILDEMSSLINNNTCNSKICYKSRKGPHHKVASMYCAHLHSLTLLQTKLLHYVLFCSANFLLWRPICNRANFYLKSIGSGKLIYIGKDKLGSIQMLKES